VMLAAYADESGTEDRTGRRAKIAVAGGYVASSDEWAVFNDQWKRILEKYNAKFFHFREWAIASAIVRKKRPVFSEFYKNPYCGWPLNKLDPFILELAEVASTRKEGTFGGYNRERVSFSHFNILMIWTHGGLRLTKGHFPGGRRASPVDFRAMPG